MGFVANFIRFPVAYKFWKSVKIWQRYWEFKGGNFFWDTVYIYPPQWWLWASHLLVMLRTIFLDTRHFFLVSRWDLKCIVKWYHLKMPVQLN